MTEGNIFHGALTLDRLYGNRPTNGFNSYGTPVKGLYLCGSGTHPGGGVMGAPGKNCAEFINKYVSWKITQTKYYNIQYHSIS